MGLPHLLLILLGTSLRGVRHWHHVAQSRHVADLEIARLSLGSDLNWPPRLSIRP